VLEGRQRIGRIRLATERMPCVWIWNVSVHLTGGLPMGTAKDLDTAKAEFKAGWEALKARTPPEQLAAAYRADEYPRRRLTNDRAGARPDHFHCDRPRSVSGRPRPQHQQRW
jgi:hypothetical protein